MNIQETKKQLKNQTGVILLLTLFILSGILIITLGAADLVMAGIRMNRLTGYSSLAFFASESGMEKVLWEARKNTSFSLPGDSQEGLMTGSLDNGSSYAINYASSSPNIFFTSIGSYGGAKRSVESTYEIWTGPSCTPDCDGKECGDDGCEGSCGSCGANETCLAYTCVGNSQTYTCSAKPTTGTDWNTVSSYSQTWSGSAWTPADDPTTEYNATADTNSCRYTCATNYTWNSSSCVADTQTYTCSAKPTTGTIWNTVSSYSQTWNGSAWTPADDSTTEYNATADTNSCRYTCATNYTWNSSSCVADTRTYTCTGNPANSSWNTVSSITQTWNGTDWTPAGTANYGGPSTTECYYTCDSGYTYSGGSCIVIPPVNLDLMEYASDANAQAAYVTSQATIIDIGPGAIFRSSNASSNTRTRIDIGNPANDTGILTTFEIYLHADSTDVKMGTFSKNSSSFTNRDFESLGNVTSGSKQTFTGKNCDVKSGDYLGSYFNTGNLAWSASGGQDVYYYSGNAFTGGALNFTFDDGHTSSIYATGISGLQSYSESTIKTTPGTYSLKGVAGLTSGLNKTLTRTIASPLDLTGKNTLTFSIRASRTGSNIKIGIHDTGGTTSEITPNITSADTFQTVTWDISGIATANKDAVDEIIITIVNADTSNIFYIDNMLAP
jgi:hypothetical protein